MDPADTTCLNDEAAERTVLRGCMMFADETFPRLDAIGFKVDDFAYHHHAVVFTELNEMWVAFEKIDLVTTYDRLRRPIVFGKKVTRITDELGVCPALWLADTWDGSAVWWPAKLNDLAEWWADPFMQDEPYPIGHALAAGRYVQWFAARRNAIHRAKELIRDAASGSASPDYFNGAL